MTATLSERARMIVGATALHGVPLLAALLVALLAAFSVGGGARASAVRPVNDDLPGEPIAAAHGRIQGSTADATPQRDETHEGPSVWYVWTAPVSGTEAFGTCGDGIATTVALFTSTSPAPTEPADLDERGYAAGGCPAGSGGALLRHPVVGGVTYLVQVVGRGGAQGAFTLEWQLESPTVSVTDAAVTEPAEGPGTAVFTVALDRSAVEPVRVGYATEDDTAIAGEDYEAASGEVTVATGETSQTIEVAVLDDRVAEAPERFALVLSVDDASVTLSNARPFGLIGDVDQPSDDAFPGAVASGASGQVTGDNRGATAETGEPNPRNTVWFEWRAPNTGDAVFDTCASDAALDTVLAVYARRTESAPSVSSLVLRAWNDDAPTPPGAGLLVRCSRVTTSVTAGKTYHVQVGGFLGAEGTFPLSWVLRPYPDLAIGDVVVEREAGTAVFPITLSTPFAEPVTVKYATRIVGPTLGAPATANADFIPIPAASGGTLPALTIPAGVTSATIEVPLIDDALDEHDEVFQVVLSQPVRALIADGVATAVLVDDDPLPAISIADAAVIEGTGGQTVARLAVTLSAASGRDVTVSYATAAASRTPARAGADHPPVPSSGGAVPSLRFPAGATRGEISIPVTADDLDEPDERFLVQLSSPSFATLRDAEAVVVIEDDDAPPHLSVGDAEVIESGPGAVSELRFPVTLSAISGRTISVRYSTADLPEGSADAATAGSDYTAVPVSGAALLTIPAGTRTGTVSIEVHGDAVLERNERMLLRLSSPVDVVLADAEAMGTIVDDGPKLSIGDVRLGAEGHAGVLRRLSFPVRLSRPLTEPVSVGYTTANGTASGGIGGATAPGDFDPVPASGSAPPTITIPAGQTSAEIVVQVRGDDLDESDERLFVRLTSPTGALVADGEAVGVIGDDDPWLRVGDTRVWEGTPGATRRATLTVTLSSPVSSTVRVRYATRERAAGMAGSARAPVDFVAIPDPGAPLPEISIPAGATRATITVMIAGDALDEPDESLFVVLSSPVRATIADGQGVVTIVDDDPPQLRIADTTVTETADDGSGVTRALLQLTLSSASAKDVTVRYASAGRGVGAATPGADYAPVPAPGDPLPVVVIPAGQVTATISVDILDDEAAESEEWLAVDLSSPSGATIADGRGLVRIADDDQG